MCKISKAIDRQASTDRRVFLKAAGAATLGAMLGPKRSFAALPQPENAMSPDDAVARLLEGNERYVSGESRPHNFSARREALISGQNPFAAILSCADSRISPEYAFDSSRGDLFVVRVAGNFVSPNGLASLEYAANYLGTRLFMVLGHDSCGAISGAISTIRDGAVLPGHLPSLIEAIAPAVGMAVNQPGDLLENSIRENVRLNTAALKAASPILSRMVANNEVKIVGGIYRLNTGKVELLS